MESVSSQVWASDRRPIVFYDGYCPFCHGLVSWLLAQDHQQKLRFAPLKGETAQAELPDELATQEETVVLKLADGSLLARSTAIFTCAGYLPAPWSWFRLLNGLPRFLRDGVYRLIARNRYRLFGRLPAQKAPQGADSSRLLP
jgi:predicted DCC family thiol-disulfide oxidoreductase YuxK